MKLSLRIALPFVLALVAGVFIVAAATVNAQAAVCDTEFLGNRIHACYFYWPGGGPDRVPPSGLARPYSQEDFTIPENVGSYTVFDFNGGWVWSWSRWRWEQVNIRNTRRPFSTSGIWRGAVKFRAGTYTFRTISDDGVELLIDGQQKISRWNDHGDARDSAQVTFTEPGWHTIQLKWYQGGGGARLKFWWDYTPASCDASFSQNKLHACFYEWGGGDQNKVGAVPSALVGQGDITISENTEQYVPIDYSNNWERKCRRFANRNDWCRWEQREIEGSGGVKQSGSYGVAERYAGVWRGRVRMKAGSYDFHTISDDGVELIIDGRNKINRWNDHGATHDNATVIFDTEGWHDIQLKWYQGGGGARLKFWWDNYKPLCDTTFKDNTLHACFFKHNNYDDIPTGATPVVAQWDERQLGSANSAIESGEAFKYQPSYNQAVGTSGEAFYVGGIWRGRINFKGGRYIFHTLSDDGVDVRIDDAEVIRNWTIHGDTENTKEIKLTQGYHNVQLKWFQNWGGATIRFWWERLNDPPTLDIVEPKEAYVLVNPQEVNDRNPKQYPLYVRSSDPDSGRNPEVTFVIRDSQNRRLLNTTVQEPNSNGASRTAARSGDRYRYYAPAVDFQSRDASRLRSAPRGLGIQILQPGVYIFDVSSKDNQGAVTAKSTKVTVNQAPQFRRVSSSNPLFTKKSTDTSTVTVEADVTDEDGISSVTIQKDSDTPVAAERVGSSDTYRATFTLSVRDAAYVFTVKATDANPVKQETAQNGQGISITVRKENESPGKPRFTIPGVPSGQKHFWLPKDKDTFVASVSDLTDPDDNISRVSLMIDGNEVDYKNGSDIRDGKVTLQWKDPTDGKHTVNVRVVDYGAPRSFTVDGDSKSEEWNTTPDVSFFPRPASYEYGETVSLGARATDGDGIEKVEYFEGNTLIGTGARGSGRSASTYTVQWTGDKDPGRHSVRVVATDTRGGVASAPNEYAFDVKKPPIPQLSTIEIKDRDDNGILLSNLATRKQTIGASIVFDIAAPTTATLNGKIMGGSQRSNQITSLDSAIAKGAASGTLTFPDISEGAYRLNLTLTDKYGTQSTGTIDFTIVKPNEPPSKPNFSIPGVPSGQKHYWLPKDKDMFVVPVSNLSDPDGNISRVSLLIDGSEVDYKNGNEIRDNKVTLQWKDPTDGKHTVNVRVVDSGSPRSFTVDGTAQSAEWNIVPTNTMPAFPGRKSTFEFGEDVPLRAAGRDADGIASVEFFEGGTRIGAGTPFRNVRYDFTWSGDKDPGSHTVRAIATDKRDAVSESAASYTFTINKPPIPQVKTLTIKNRDSAGVVLSNLSTRKQTIVASVEFDRSAPTSATLKVELVPKSGQTRSQNSAIGKGASNATVTFADMPEGAYRMNITLTDKYGTQSTGTIDFTIVKPNEPPVIDSWTIEGVRGNTHTVTRPDKYTLIATAYDPDPTQPSLTLFRNDEVFSASPTITAKTTSSGKSGYEYRYVFEAREKGTLNYTVQASDGKLSSDVTSPLSITMNNAIPTVTRVEPEDTLTTDPVVPVYADARDPDGSIRDVTFTVYDSGNRRVFNALSPSKDYIPPQQGDRGGFTDRDRYYAPSPYKATVGGRKAFARSVGEVGVLRFPSPGVYTLAITSRDNDGAYSREDRTTVTINDVPVATGFKVVEGAEVLTPVGSARARITFEAQTRDDVGGIANVALYNVQNEKVADFSKTGDNVYRHTLDLDARTGDYQFFVEPKDVHGEVGRRIGVQVKITKSNTVKLFSSSTRVPGHQSGTYYIIPTEQVRFGFNDAFDNVRDPVEFFIRDQKLQTRKAQDNPPVYEWTNPSYGTHEVSAKLPHASVVEQTPVVSFTVYDAIQTRDETASATSFAAPYIHSIKTKTPRNGLVTVGGASGPVPITIIARSKGSKIRAMRVFERSKSAEGITIQIPSADRNFGNEHTRDFIFPGLAEGAHTFIAKVMDEVGEVSEERAFTVFVAQAGNQEVISNYEDFYGLNNARAVTSRPSTSAVILKESKTTTGLSERPPILPTNATNQQKILNAYPKERAQPQNVERRGVLDILRAVWNFILRKN